MHITLGFKVTISVMVILWQYPYRYPPLGNYTAALPTFRCCVLLIATTVGETFVRLT